MNPTNEQKVSFIFSTLKETGTTITDFSKVSSVSRNALHKWKKGGNINDTLRLNIAFMQARKLRKFRGKSKAQIISALKQPWSI